MAQFTEEQLNKIWEKGLKDDKYNPDFVRKDACGAWMIKGRYNDRSSSFGWEVDHIYPESKLRDMNVPQQKIDDICNLRPLNWNNNVSKGSDYPHYQSFSFSIFHAMRYFGSNPHDGKIFSLNIHLLPY